MQRSYRIVTARLSWQGLGCHGHAGLLLRGLSFALPLYRFSVPHDLSLRFLDGVRKEDFLLETRDELLEEQLG